MQRHTFIKITFATLAPVLILLFTNAAPTYVTKLSVPATVTSSGHQNDPLVFAGYLDVTLYGADPTGLKDSTTAFQNALLDASGNSTTKLSGVSMAVYVPTGKYLISKTLTGYQGCASNGSVPPNRSFGAGNGVSAPSLVGPANGTRPTIILKDGVFTNAASPQPMVHMVNSPNAGTGGCGNQWWKTSAIGAFDILFNTVVRDINFETGNNAGAIGVQFYSAQMSYMQNVKIDATNGYAGIQGSPATETWVNIEVNGGQYGVLIANTGGANSIAGLTLENQSVAGLSYASIGGLSLAGFNIQENNPAAVGIVTKSAMSQGSQVSLIDGEITVSGNSAAISNVAQHSLYLNNVFIKAPKVAITNGSATLAGTGQMREISEYSHADPSTNANTSGLNYALDAVIVNDGVHQSGDYGPIYGTSNPPSDLVSRNLPGQLPWAFDKNVVWVTDFGADETGVVDSTAAIREAVAAAHSNGSEEVFLPRGKYLLSGTVVLNPNTKFFGVPGGYSQIITGNWNTGGKVEFLVQVGDAINNPVGTLAGKAIMSDIEFDLPTLASGSISALEQSYIAAIHWQTGAGSVLNQVYTGFQYQTTVKIAAPTRNIIQVDNGGGGRWYGLQAIGDNGPNSTAGYQLLVTNTSSPMSIYGSNIEHAAGNSFYGFINASNIRVLGAKTEDGSAPYWFYISDASNVMLSAITNHGASPTMVTNGSSNVSINATGFYSSNTSATEAYITDAGVPYRFGDNYALFKSGSFNDSVFATGAAASTQPPPPTPTPVPPTPTPAPTATPKPAPTPTPVTVPTGTTVSPSSVPAGQTITIKGTYTATQTTSALLVLWLTDSATSKVIVKATPTVSFKANVPTPFQVTVTMPTTAPVGAYHISTQAYRGSTTIGGYISPLATFTVVAP